MQALEDSICATLLLCFVCHKSLVYREDRTVARKALYAPEPTQDIHGENSNARSGGNTGERLFCAGFPVGETVPADHDGNQTCNTRNGASEECFVWH